MAGLLFLLAPLQHFAERLSRFGGYKWHHRALPRCALRSNVLRFALAPSRRLTLQEVQQALDGALLVLRALLLLGQRQQGLRLVGGPRVLLGLAEHQRVVAARVDVLRLDLGSARERVGR